ncbi:MAG TPA: D-alanyl-D-alanine carboxypeptidase family protein [Candidatus Angelobacter sp.]|nr:D-alanyl-D-alanine carboxypeptidase family protein [Candidatus Angelobacter sp.]
MKKRANLKQLNKVWIYLLVVALFGGTVVFPGHASAQTGPTLQAKSALLVDAKTGKILYEKNADQMLPPASMTKMMTEYLVLKAIDSGKIKWTTVVPVSNKVKDLSRDQSFSGFPLRTDYKYTVSSLFDALIIPSSNAAAMAFADLLGGNESKFVDQMNQTAKTLGMTKTKYTNSSGLDNVDLGSKYIAQGGPNDTDLTTAKDLAILSYHLLNDFSASVSNQAIQVSSTARKDFQAGPGEVDHMVSTNWMLSDFDQYGPNMKVYEYQGVDGLKTGYTSLAGYCFAGSVVRGDRRFLSVVMGTRSEGDRFLQTKALYDYGFQQTSNQTIVKAGYTFKNQKTLPVSKGKQDQVGIAVNKTLSLPIDNGEKNNYKVVLHLNKSLLNADGTLQAPVKKGQKVGYATVESTSSDKLGYIGQAPKLDVVATSSVDKANWFVLLFRNVGHFFSGLIHHGK